ncbi:bacterioferritin-associated ferredoxin [Embleya sp. NBC_00896]|uniref:(2Fe-2S)-binding protein n=1 Tax=Embleya sp. NBC_00896 TaxID=2975961 RepID=UPI0038702F8B|nr:(2Fe-2S)-binding protein [Embleya sp. NBC_00896]
MCFGVTDKQVNDRIADGARTMREIAQSCGGAGTDCGRCVKSITAMLPRDESKRRRRSLCGSSDPCSAGACGTGAEGEPVALPMPVVAAGSVPDNVVPLHRSDAA